MEQKAVCGGFLVGDGLEMNGKVLSATGGGGIPEILEVEPAGANIKVKNFKPNIPDIVACGGVTVGVTGYYMRASLASCDGEANFIFTLNGIKYSATPDSGDDFLFVPAP